MGQMKRREEREYVARQKEAGRVCARCERVLDPPQRPGQRRCAVCEPRMHVHMCFERYPLYWLVTFKPLGSPRVLPRTFRFGGTDKVRDLYERFGVRRMSEDVQAFEFGIRSGKGIVELALGDEQYRVLSQVRGPS